MQHVACSMSGDHFPAFLKVQYLVLRMLLSYTLRQKNTKSAQWRHPNINSPEMLWEKSFMVTLSDALNLFVFTLITSTRSRLSSLLHLPQPESTADAVRKILSRVNMRKAAGPDKHPCPKKCANQIADVVTGIPNILLPHETVPTCIKTATCVSSPKNLLQKQ